MLTLSPEKLKAILQRPEQELDRVEFPKDFPDPIDVPAGRYYDPAFYKLEKELVLNKSWQYAGHSDQIPNKGDYILLEAYEEPIFLIRGKDMQIRALYNVCKHRGATLLTEPKGNKKLIACPFHSWTYDSSGNLRGFPEAKNYPRNVRKDECLSLSSIQCETFGNLVFIKFSEGGPNLRTALGPIADELDYLVGDKSDDVRLAAHEIKWVDGNWKLAGDANVETYHVPYLHKDTAAPMVDEKRTGQWLLPNGHSRMLLRYLPEVHKQMNNGEYRMPPFKGIEQNRLPMEGIYSFHFFPNISLVMSGPEMWFIISAIPHGPDRHAYQVDYITPIAKEGEYEKLVNALFKFNSKILDEDLEMMPGMQDSMKRGIIKKLKLQYQERRIRRLHEDLDKMIGEENIPEHLRVPSLLDDYVEES